MRIHANARTCPNSRKLLVRRIEEENWSLMAAAEAAGISERSARKWLGRWRAEGDLGLLDRSSAPKRVPSRLPADRLEAIEALRRLRMTAAEIAEVLGRALSTVSRWLARIGLGKRSALAPPEPPNRYERKRPGELIHVDVKKLGRIQGGAGKRVRGGNRSPYNRQETDGAGVRRKHGRLGVRPRLRRRRHPPRLRGGPPRREGRHRGGLPAPGGRLVQGHGHHRRAGALRQRLLLPLPVARAGLPGARDAPPLHPPLPASHQRQGGALHPDADQPLGLRSDLRLLRRANRGPIRLARPLQLQKTTRLPRSQAARSSARRAGTTS